MPRTERALSELTKSIVRSVPVRYVCTADGSALGKTVRAKAQEPNSRLPAVHSPASSCTGVACRYSGTWTSTSGQNHAPILGTTSLFYQSINQKNLDTAVLKSTPLIALDYRSCRRLNAYIAHRRNST